MLLILLLTLLRTQLGIVVVRLVVVAVGKEREKNVAIVASFIIPRRPAGRSALCVARGSTFIPLANEEY